MPSSVGPHASGAAMPSLPRQQVGLPRAVSLRTRISAQAAMPGLWRAVSPSSLVQWSPLPSMPGAQPDPAQPP
eukprot:10190522-Lingulodinium_polyedra.AAC.1